MDHRSKRAAEEESLPEYHMGYCFPGDEGGQKLTILVVVERHSKMKKAVVVPSKGSTGRYAARMVIDLIEEYGDKDRAIIVKSDQEPAVQFLVDDVCMSRTGAKTIVEQAPKGSKGSNGIVERAVQSTEQYLRTLKSTLDERISFRIDAKHPILTWLCEYAGYIINARWGYGLFIGVRAKSNELIIVDQETKDIMYVRTVRRVPLEQRWSADNLEWVRGVPWNRGKEDDDADGDVPEFDVTHGPGRRLTLGEMEEMATQETPSLTKKDFDKFGFTDRCPGCSAIIRGLRVQPHAEHCRRRLEKHLETDLKVKNAKVRSSERNRKVREEQGQDMDHKRRRLDDIEDAVMKENDPEQLATLYERFRKEYEEYLMDKAEKEGSDIKRRKLVDAEGETMESCAPKRDRASSQKDLLNNKRQKGETPMRGVATSSRDEALYEEMNIDLILRQGWTEQEQGELGHLYEYAWDDVNNMELPIEKVREAREEEMKYMKGKTFKVVKKSEAYRVTGKGPMSTKSMQTKATETARFS